ncbi:hypothetical protein C8R45DRAFT_923039 [Mycena sanguinolenta]|nr:hypothetical protein C8R45DRAFT_923039 [Mycena sanguinolenta]
MLYAAHVLTRAVAAALVALASHFATSSIIADGIHEAMPQASGYSEGGEHTCLTANETHTHSSFAATTPPADSSEPVHMPTAAPAAFDATASVLHAGINGVATPAALLSGVAFAPAPIPVAAPAVYTSMSLAAPVTVASAPAAFAAAHAPVSFVPAPTAAPTMFVPTPAALPAGVTLAPVAAPSSAASGGVFVALGINCNGTAATPTVRYPAKEVRLGPAVWGKDITQQALTVIKEKRNIATVDVKLPVEKHQFAAASANFAAAKLVSATEPICPLTYHSYHQPTQPQDDTILNGMQGCKSIQYSPSNMLSIHIPNRMSEIMTIKIDGYGLVTDPSPVPSKPVAAHHH